MPIDVLRYFEALGLPIAEAWGMSETAGGATGEPARRDPRRHLRDAAGRASSSSSPPTASCSSAARP